MTRVCSCVEGLNQTVLIKRSMPMSREGSSAVTQAVCLIQHVLQRPESGQRRSTDLSRSLSKYNTELGTLAKRVACKIQLKETISALFNCNPKSILLNFTGPIFKSPKCQQPEHQIGNI